MTFWIIRVWGSHQGIRSSFLVNPSYLYFMVCLGNTGMYSKLYTQGVFYNKNRSEVPLWYFHNKVIVACKHKDFIFISCSSCYEMTDLTIILWCICIWRKTIKLDCGKWVTHAYECPLLARWPYPMAWQKVLCMFCPLCALQWITFTLLQFKVFNSN